MLTRSGYASTEAIAHSHFFLFGVCAGECGNYEKYSACSSKTVIGKLKLKKRLPCSCESWKPATVFFSFHRGVNAVNKFDQTLELFAREFHLQKTKIPELSREHH